MTRPDPVLICPGGHRRHRDPCRAAGQCPGKRGRPAGVPQCGGERLVPGGEQHTGDRAARLWQQRAEPVEGRQSVQAGQQHAGQHIPDGNPPDRSAENPGRRPVSRHVHHDGRPAGR